MGPSWSSSNDAQLKIKIMLFVFYLCKLFHVYRVNSWQANDHNMNRQRYRWGQLNRIDLCVNAFSDYRGGE